METYLFWIVPIASLLALVLAWYFYKQMMLESEGTPGQRIFLVGKLSFKRIA